MAGMLPGVEAARRRRFHQSQTSTDGVTASRRSSFCLYVTNNQDFHFNSHSSLEKSHTTRAVSDDEMLDAAVREAKNRLDQRLHCKSGSKRRVKGQETLGSAEGIGAESQGSFKSNLYKLILKSG